MIKNYSQLFIDPKIQYPHLDKLLNFDDYIKQCKNLIQNTRLDLGIHSELIVNANSPFELKPNTSNRTGVLLIHGLLDSPLTMQDIGKELQASGCLVRSVLLPGHGTIPGALLSVRYTDWIKTVNAGVESLAKEVDRLFLIGYSTGGALALHQAIKNQGKIAGLVLIVPALKINCPLDFIANGPAAVGQIWPQAAWFHKDKEETLDYSKYLSTPFNAAYQVYRIAKEVKKSSYPICPLLFAIAENDLTVLSHVTINYFQNNPNPDNKMILYSNKKTTFSDKRIIVRPSNYPNMNIVDYSHISIPIAPSNSHYGIDGDYIHASHIKQDKHTLFGEYYLPPMRFHNKLYAHKLAAYEHQRLSFNPDFEFFKNQMLEWMHL